MGFQLSVFGFDAEADHAAITKEGRGRRINLAAASHSLLLRKATGETPHGGGTKLDPDGLWYRRVSRWIAEGARLDGLRTSRARPLVVTPSEAVMSPETGMQLQVFVVDPSGQRTCVTQEAEYISNDVSVAKVDSDGWVRVPPCARRVRDPRPI